MYLETRHDTPKFELALMQKICFDSGWMLKGGFDLPDYDWLSVACACNVRCDVS